LETVGKSKIKNRKSKIVMNRIARYVLAAFVLGVVGFAGWRGWQWRANAKVQQVTVTGARHAAPDSLRALAAVDTSDALYGLDPLAVAERVERHPWVRSASVERRPPGELAVSVTERTPVALALKGDASGHYLDAAGYRMPATGNGPAYDVPLLRGVSSDSPRVQSDTLRALLTTLGDLDARTETLLSELILSETGAVTARTVPAPDGRASLSVKLGRRPWKSKLRRVRPFWQQAVVRQPKVAFEHVDLRFDGQVVTEQHEREDRDP